MSISQGHPRCGSRLPEGGTSGGEGAGKWPSTWEVAFHVGSGQKYPFWHRKTWENLEKSGKKHGKLIETWWIEDFQELIFKKKTCNAIGFQRFYLAFFRPRTCWSSNRSLPPSATKLRNVAGIRKIIGKDDGHSWKYGNFGRWTYGK